MGRTSADLSTQVVGANGETERRGTLSKDGIDNLIDTVRRAETKLQKYLKDAGVVITDRVLPAEKPQAPKKTQHDSISQPTNPDFVAPLKLDEDGKVCDSVASRAFDMGLAVGCHVERELASGTSKQYVIKCLEQDRMILTSFDERKEELEVTLEGMVSIKMMKPPAKRKKTKIEPDTRMPGKQWELIPKADVEDCIKHWVYTSMFHIHVQASPDFHIVRCHQEQDGEHYTLDQAIKKNQLVLVPYAKKYVAKKSGTPHTFVPISYSLKAGANWAAMAASSEGCTTLFWKLLGSSAHQPDGPTTLTWKTASIEAPLKCTRGVQKDVSGLARASLQKTLVIKFPYLTNHDDLPERCRLTVPPASIIPIVTA